MANSELFGALKALQSQIETQSLTIQQTLYQHMAKINSRFEDFRSQIQISQGRPLGLSDPPILSTKPPEFGWEDLHSHFHGSPRNYPGYTGSPGRASSSTGIYSDAIEISRYGTSNFKDLLAPCRTKASQLRPEHNPLHGRWLPVSEEGLNLKVPPIKSESVALEASREEGNSWQSKELDILDPRYFTNSCEAQKVPGIIDNAYVIVECKNGSQGMLDFSIFGEGSKIEQEIYVVGDLEKGETFVPKSIVRRGTQVERREGVKTLKVEDDRIKYNGLHHSSSNLKHLQILSAMRAKSTQVPAIGLYDGLIFAAIGIAAQLYIQSGILDLMRNVKWMFIDDLPSPYDDVILTGVRLYAVNSTDRIVIENTVDVNMSAVAGDDKIFDGDKKFFVDLDSELLVELYLSVIPRDDFGFNEGLLITADLDFEIYINDSYYHLEYFVKGCNKMHSELHLEDKVVFKGDGMIQLNYPWDPGGAQLFSPCLSPSIAAKGNKKTSLCSTKGSEENTSGLFSNSLFSSLFSLLVFGANTRSK